MFDAFIAYVLHAVEGMGYTGIAVLMAIESSFIPFPSELVVPPAGYLASQGKMNIYLIVLSGTTGSIIGALINYYIAYYLGRGILHKYGKYFFLTPAKLEKIECFFRKHGEVSTFTGRLIPLVRHYISFPAGLSGMNIPKFCFYTGLGSGIWVIILTWLGYFLGNRPDVLHFRVVIISVVLIIVVALILFVYFYYYRKKMKACD